VATILAPAARDIDYHPEHDSHPPSADELRRIKFLGEAAAFVHASIHADRAADIAGQLNEVDDIGFYLSADLKGDINFRNIQVNHVRANKFHGVEQLRRMIGIPKEQTVAIGDDDNDLSMFANAGNKIAVGNATERLKAEAHYVVASVSQDGFVEAMDRFVLEPAVIL
jgi:hydroxymethylpyrimidine pyrophosphatase-like HAD family hydrolase